MTIPHDVKKKLEALREKINEYINRRYCLLADHSIKKMQPLAFKLGLQTLSGIVNAYDAGNISFFKLSVH